jgi:hypothetical protein
MPYGILLRGHKIKKEKKKKNKKTIKGKGKEKK